MNDNFYKLEFEKKIERIENKIDSMFEWIIKLQAQSNERGLWLSKILIEFISKEKKYCESKGVRKTDTEGEE